MVGMCNLILPVNLLYKQMKNPVDSEKEHIGMV